MNESATLMTTGTGTSIAKRPAISEPVPFAEEPVPFGLLMDISGCQRLFGGEPNLLRQVLAAAGRLGFDARVASASTLGCAWAMAHFGPQRLHMIESGQERQAMEPLPARALRLDDATVKALAEVGLRRVGQVLVMPRAALRKRFGPQLLLRIDQALGLAWERVVPAEYVTAVQEELVLGGPICNLEAIRLGVGNLVAKLLARLRQRQLGVRRLEVLLKRSDAGPLPLAIPLAAASCDEKHLMTLLGPHLERANMGFGVEAIRVIAADTAAMNYQQMLLLPDVTHEVGRQRMNRRLGELIDVLGSRLGADAVTSVRAVESHVPELAFVRRIAAMGGTHAGATATPTGRSRSLRAARLGDRARPDKQGDRPSVLLEDPQPVSVTALSPDGPVVSFTWQGICHKVQTCVGPERIAPQWWGPNRQTADRGRWDRKAIIGNRSHGIRSVATRDYFKLQDDQGRWVWLYRQIDDGLWFVHGLWE